MNQFTCNVCNFSSNYKYNLKRHLLTHNKKLSTTVNEHSLNVINQPNDQQQLINTSPYPVQALNLSNNVQIPPSTKQIINIQPPPPPPVNPQPPPSRKPIIHEDDGKFFDVRLKENFKLFICGPSRSGKTEFVKKLTENIDIFSKSPPKIITLVYKVFQPIYYEMNIDHLVHDGDNLKQRLINIANGDYQKVIVADER